MKFADGIIAALGAAIMLAGPAAAAQRKPGEAEESGRSAPLVAPSDQRHPPRFTQQQPAGCEIGPESRELPLFVLGHYDSASLSSVWLGASDKETQVADIEVLGGQPIHLVITGYGRTIYRFSGDVDRIAQLTLISQYASGAIGIPRSRIQFASQCLSYQSIYRGGAASHQAVLNAFGMSAAVVAGDYALWRVRIDDQISLFRAVRNRLRIDPETDELYLFHPGGIVPIQTGAVTSNVEVGPYRVLPQEAGVRQLVMNGALVRATAPDARQWEAAARARGNNNPRAVHGLYYGVYRVTRPIEVPAGLCGSHLIRLFVPTPDFLRGDYCHSSIYFDDGTAVGPLTR